MPETDAWCTWTRNGVRTVVSHYVHANGLASCGEPALFDMKPEVPTDIRCRLCLKAIAKIEEPSDA